MRGLAGLVLLTSLVASDAEANGETTPMFGAGVIVGTSTHDDKRMAGVELEAAWWWSWLGFAVEASGRASSRAGEDDTTLVLGGSLRLRLLQMLVPSLLEPSDVELGVELQGIVERTWWDRTITDVGPLRQGIGFAVRLRGSSDSDVPRLITESRCFVRVMWAPPEDAPFAARTTMPTVYEPRDLMVVLGIGAAFGGGERRYLQQFRRRAFEGTVMRQLNSVAPD